MKRTRRNSSSQGRFDLGVIFPLDTHNPTQSLIPLSQFLLYSKPPSPPFISNSVLPSPATSKPSLSLVQPLKPLHSSTTPPSPPTTFTNRTSLLCKVLFPSLTPSHPLPLLSSSFFIRFDISFIPALFIFVSPSSFHVPPHVVPSVLNQIFNLPTSWSLKKDLRNSDKGDRSCNVLQFHQITNVLYIKLPEDGGLFPEICWVA
jgi:hypothetical protein